MNTHESMFKTIDALNQAKRTSGLESLVWFPNLETGWYPVIDDGVYNDSYVDTFVRYRDTVMGKLINDFRVATVKKYVNAKDDLIDIGIGSGHFLDQYSQEAQILGYDVSEYGIAKLSQSDRFINIDYFKELNHLTFWDSLEHIADCWRVLQKVRGGCYVFMTIPIFDSDVKVIQSKHFKPREHYWYFTRSGLVSFMIHLGFLWISEDTSECRFGRSGVSTFVFRKKFAES